MERSVKLLLNVLWWTQLSPEVKRLCYLLPKALEFKIIQIPSLNSSCSTGLLLDVKVVRKSCWADRPTLLGRV